MFEDLQEEDSDVTPDSPDRAIAYAIWSRGDTGSLTSEEAWAVLYERYPDDPRFLLLNVYAELSEVRKWDDGQSRDTILLTPTYVLQKLRRVASASSPELLPQLRDLVVFADFVCASVGEDELALLAELRSKVGVEVEGSPKRDEQDRAGLRLRRFEREVVKELHERTQEGRALGVPASTPPQAAGTTGDDWASAVSADKPRRRYAVAERFQRGELVEHPKFGVGVVTGAEPGKALILFESGVRKLVAGG